MSYIIYKTLKIIYYYKINNYKDFLNIVNKNNSKTKLNINEFFYIVINIIMLLTFFIMISGFGAYFNQEFAINKSIGAAILSLICYIFFLNDIKKVAKISNILVPFLIFVIIFAGLQNLKNISIFEFGKNIKIDTSKMWIVKSILYANYNLLILIPVLTNLRKLIKNEKQIIIISIFSGLILSLISILIFTIIMSINCDVNKIEMPVIYAINNYSKVFGRIYGIIILLAIFTTAIFVGKSFLENTKNINNNMIVYMCLSAIIISNFGFSNLVKILFPIFGYLSILELVHIFSFKF